MNKKGTTIGMLIIGVLLIIALTAGMADLLSSFSAEFGTEDFAGNLSKIRAEEDNIQQIVRTSSNATFSDEAFESIGTSSFVKGGYIAISTTKKSLLSVSNLMQVMQEELEIPFWVSTFVITSLTVAVIFLILNAIFRWNII